MPPRSLPALALAALTASLALTAPAPPAQAGGGRMSLGLGARLGSDGASLTGSFKLGLELGHNVFLTGRLEEFLLEQDWTGEAQPAGWRLGLMYEVPLPLPVGLDLGATLGQSLTPGRYARSFVNEAGSVTTALIEAGFTAKIGMARLRFYANTPIWADDDALARRVHTGELGLRLGVAL